MALFGGTQVDAEANRPNLAALHLETAVQMACVYMHDEQTPPSGPRLVAMCGEYLNTELAAANVDAATLVTWAVAEVKRRSPTFDIMEVQAQRLA